MKTYSVHYKKLDSWLDPEVVFVRLFGEKDTAFWLDSSKAEEGLSRFSYMGEASRVLSYSLQEKGPDIFSSLAKKLHHMQCIDVDVPFDFIGGFVGYFGYEIKALCGAKNSFSSEYPDSLWFFVDRFLAFDHKEKQVYLVCLTSEKVKAEKWFDLVQKELSVCPGCKSQNVREDPSALLRDDKEPIVFTLSRSHKQYLKDIAVCKKHLREGESYQICLTNTLTTTARVRPLDVYATLRAVSPAPYAAFLRHNDFSVLSSSPERFLHIDRKGWVESKPIKGTRKRSQDPKEDKRLAEELAASEKDRAENLMITDLLRNDVGKVCEIGSVSVPKLMAVESYATVHQLVSTVRGRLRKDVAPLEAIQACFPGGSMTGAPKHRTIEILETLEKKARGVYSGALGFLSLNGTVDLSIVIRTIVQKGDTFSLGAGGAILMQSDAESEYEEMMLKARALMASIAKASGVGSYSVKE